MKAFSLLGLLAVLSVVALHSAEAEGAPREEDGSNSALTELEMRELEEALRDLDASESEVRQALAAGHLQKRFLKKLVDFGKKVGDKIKNWIKGSKSGPPAQ